MSQKSRPVPRAPGRRACKPVPAPAARRRWRRGRRAYSVEVGAVVEVIADELGHPVGAEPGCQQRRQRGFAARFRPQQRHPAHVVGPHRHRHECPVRPRIRPNQRRRHGHGRARRIETHVGDAEPPHQLGPVGFGREHDIQISAAIPNDQRHPDSPEIGRFLGLHGYFVVDVDHPHGGQVRQRVHSPSKAQGAGNRLAPERTDEYRHALGRARRCFNQMNVPGVNRHKLAENEGVAVGHWGTRNEE